MRRPRPPACCVRVRACVPACVRAQESGDTTWEAPPDVLWLRYTGDATDDKWFANMKTSAFQREKPSNVELKIVTELRDTERTYLRKLRLLIKIYSKPLQHLEAAGTPLIPDASWRQIFDNTESIFALAENFYDKLTLRTAANKQQPRLVWPHELLLEAFAQLLDFFKLYSSYFDK